MVWTLLKTKEGRMFMFLSDNGGNSRIVHWQMNMSTSDEIYEHHRSSIGKSSKKNISGLKFVFDAISDCLNLTSIIRRFIRVRSVEKYSDRCLGNSIDRPRDEISPIEEKKCSTMFWSQSIERWQWSLTNRMCCFIEDFRSSSLVDRSSTFAFFELLYRIFQSNLMKNKFWTPEIKQISPFIKMESDGTLIKIIHWRDFHLLEFVQWDNGRDFSSFDRIFSQLRSLIEDHRIRMKLASRFFSFMYFDDPMIKALQSFPTYVAFIIGLAHQCFSFSPFDTMKDFSLIGSISEKYRSTLIKRERRSFFLFLWCQ